MVFFFLKSYNEGISDLPMASKIKASHILVEKHSQAEKIYDQVTKNNFADLAKQHSTCPSRRKGGNLGEFGRGQMVKEFEKVAFGMNVGEISKPVKTKFGYHIIMRTK
jgi:peptidyl-prolyl cis-trans isomerase C